MGQRVTEEKLRADVYTCISLCQESSPGLPIYSIFLVGLKPNNALEMGSLPFHEKQMIIDSLHQSLEKVTNIKGGDAWNSN